MAASIATTITAVRIGETLICRSLSLHQLRKLIIVLSHECNIFLELNRLCALERGIKLLQIPFLFCFQYRFVGFNRVDLLLDLFRWLGEFYHEQSPLHDRVEKCKENVSLAAAVMMLAGALEK
jgi:hypothetical protein